ncbi:hypothetical protein HG537_0B04530 [Torulaspora globosa]|uniref:Dol-P-Man:Man(5)GlcNAc(2)-PP-Dol alpha-1,3-mannosyltransferase n=1 Tax=Torulaspora globosa TaxID=48254 RepID=A0A7H9HRW3_9SACH|nr:hypothetical protein HG537_0B04530 [Torulaspora sp. CBS 2947]
MVELVEGDVRRLDDLDRPKFNLWKDCQDAVKFLCFNPKGNAIVMPLLLIMESIALKVITAMIPYTEIDYQAYMEQIEMITIDKGLDYSQITGCTGPLVYPAGHVMVYKLMYKLTQGMEFISQGQMAFRYLYLATMVLQMVVYYQLKLPPWCVVFACLSKRLHSIYVLRLFNDCFTTFFMVLTVLLLIQGCRKRNAAISLLASLVYSIAVSIKMNALLYLPAFMVSVFLINEGRLAVTLCCFATSILWQVLVAIPFLRAYPMEYLQGAFNFSRRFLFKWSVNWQMIGEDGFDSTVFHRSLLISQLVGILTVILFKYPKLLKDAMKSLRHPLSKVTTPINALDVVPFILLTTNFIGVIFSRSLHYQFLTWYHWTIPVLLHYSRLPWFVAPLWYILHEYCWNSYPPNSQASALLLTLNATLLLLIIANNLTSYTKPAIVQKKEQ